MRAHYSKVTLKSSLEAGDGTIGNLYNWRAHDPLLRADLLQHWIYLLQCEYDIAHDQCFRGGKRAKKLIKELDKINK